AGRRIPGDVRVAGFDDSSIATESRPQLTTVHQPLTEIGRRMAQLLIRRITTGDPVRSALLPTSLVLRESA
ncbi:MAG TPA: substrate-binding domain-containing protein, partial [Mycobacteriales bacterium]|nr:substrate-binding domain-containing protein [Mycobacteriales bacterium]